jgi:hypothetical protein
LGRNKINGPTHYGQRSRFTLHTMCGQIADGVRYRSDWRQVTCDQCIRMKHEGAVLYPGGERNPRAE